MATYAYLSADQNNLHKNFEHIARTTQNEM